MAALKTKFDNLILTEIIQRPKRLQFTTDEATRGSEHNSAEKVLDQDTSESYIEEPVRLPVLTLYGGGPQPKQLFSSLQQPLTTEPRTLTKPDSLREEALPNGISTSKVIPVHSVGSAEEKKSVPTLGELFPAPSNLQVLNPPRQSRITASRSTFVNWVKIPESTPSSNTHRRTYPLQPLATSQWLSYDAVPSSIQQAYSEERRKERNRALSGGERQLPPKPKRTAAAHSAAKSDALFCGAYSSSFAPVSDSTGSIVPDHSKHSIWWKQNGERRHRELLHSTYPQDTNGNLQTPHKAPHLLDFHEDDIPRIVESWTSAELPPELLETKAPRAPESKSDLDILIGEISDLLETLHSYQRTRNLSPTNSTLASANPDLSALCGSPASPSSVERDVYSMLQSQLALIISTLPPYALSKLNGERLGLLNASTKIPVEGKNYVGSVEEEELTIKARAPNVSSAVGYPPRPTSVNPAIPARINGYTHTPNTPAQTVPRAVGGAVPRAASTSTPQLPNQQYSSRPASANHFFTGTAHSAYPPQRPAPMTADRFSHPKPPQYGQRPAPSPHTPLPNGYRAHASQNGPSGPQYTGTPQAIQTPVTMDAASKAQRPSQPGYQQKAMNAVGYPFGSRTAGREASPSKKPPAAVSVPRLPPSTPGPPASQARPAGYQPQPAPTGAGNAAAQSVNGSGGNGSVGVGPAAQFLHLTRAEQEAVMNSQKVRLAQREGRSGSGSSTPQPGGGTHRATPSRAAVSQPNGA